MFDTEASTTPEWVFPVTARDFDTRVAQASVPVLVDFWAPWCGPCQQIGPMLEQLAERYAGRLHIAKVNVDEETTLAAGFGVRSIPMLVLFNQGKVVEQLVGLQPEQELVRLIDPHVSRAPNQLRTAVQNALLAGDHASARTLLEQALEQEPENAAIRVDLARAELALGEPEAARARLNDLPEDIDASRDVAALRAEIGLAEATAGTPPDSVLATALAAIAARDYGTAMNALLEVFRTGEPADRDAAREHLIAIFELLGSADERVQDARRALANLMN